MNTGPAAGDGVITIYFDVPSASFSKQTFLYYSPCYDAPQCNNARTGWTKLPGVQMFCSASATVTAAEWVYSVKSNNLEFVLNDGADK